MIMTSKWLNSLQAQQRRDGYYQIAEWLIRPGIVHALEPAFVPWARPLIHGCFGSLRRIQSLLVGRSVR